MSELKDAIGGCELCVERFARTVTQHTPRPVVWFAGGAKILIAGQAPGARVHDSGRPFTDRSGDRLRDWMGIDTPTFYDVRRIAIVPMAFCFPGYNAAGSDLPPPAVCAQTWRARVMTEIGAPDVTLLIGGAAMKWHLGADFNGVNRAVTQWRDYAPRIFPLPHPSWRNTAWLRKNPWFEADVLPALRSRLQEVLNQ